MFEPNVILDNVLTEMNVKHQFETYVGTHISNLYERLGKVWVELSNGFPEYE
jgi:vacuolar-type H+-ATPase catalytic subunit A/Vma1